jgi:hypothetical protein
VALHGINGITAARMKENPAKQAQKAAQMINSLETQAAKQAQHKHKDKKLRSAHKT